MKATQANFQTLLNGARQFIIPIYQRTYSWTLKQCDQLWRDIVRAGNDPHDTGHFIGSLVYIEKGIYQVSAIPELLIIDGQQRLTTISLLLLGLRQALRQKAGLATVTPDEITDYYLVNTHGKGDQRYKLVLTQNDKSTLINLVEGLNPPQDPSRRILDNFDFFTQQLQNPGVDLETVYKGICRLIIVDISLDRSNDNPQLIFESLNSTGLALSHSDYFVLMGLDRTRQEALYNNHWYPMEQSFGQTDYAILFDRFMRDYLTVRTGDIPNIAEVYDAFKVYARNFTGSIENLVADIRNLSQYFVDMAFERDADPDRRRKLHDINTLRVNVAYPFLLEVYEDHKNGLLGAADVLAVFQLIESYVFRRAVCGIPTNTLNKTFATLAGEIDKQHYLESFKASLLLKESNQRFPSDDEFAQELVVKDLYNFRNRNYWLDRLENYDRKERVNVEEYTIEHILPQNENPRPEWIVECGHNWKEIQARHLHTLGNLTLTGYNSELSDRPFIEKRDMKGGFKDSPLRLNRDLASLEHWNQETIKARAQSLAKLALRVWPVPDLPVDAVENYRQKKRGTENAPYTVEGLPNLEGDRRALFEQLRKRIVNLDASVREEVWMQHVSYKVVANFVAVKPLVGRLRITLNMPFEEVHDPKALCTDVTGKDRLGGGDVEVSLVSIDQLDDVSALVKQAFDKQLENGE